MSWRSLNFVPLLSGYRVSHIAMDNIALMHLYCISHVAMNNIASIQIRYLRLAILTLKLNTTPENAYGIIFAFVPIKALLLWRWCASNIINLYEMVLIRIKSTLMLSVERLSSLFLRIRSQIGIIIITAYIRVLCGFFYIIWQSRISYLIDICLCH